MMDALDRVATGIAPRENDHRVLSGLRNKSLLLMGDSTDGNLWERMCHCPRIKTRPGEPVGNCELRDPRYVKCYGVDSIFASCDYTNLDLQIHYAQAAYADDPYPGEQISKLVGMPRNHLPPCQPDDPLATCYMKKWLGQNNSRFGLGCMREGSARQPLLVVVNVNMWYWWKLKQKPKHRNGPDREVIVNGEWRQREAFKRNLTTLIHQLRSLVTPDASLLALHTTVLPIYRHMTNVSSRLPPGAQRHTPRVKRKAARVDLQNVAMGNAAIRGLSREMGLGLADWESMLHLGWPRELVLFDDLHPRRSVNTFLAQLWLHALSVL